jgi:hypothetical protein
VPSSARMTAKAKAYAKALSNHPEMARNARRLSGLKSGPRDPVAFERHVHATKGKWLIIPPEVVKTAERVETVRQLDTERATLAG